MFVISITSEMCFSCRGNSDCIVCTRAHDTEGNMIKGAESILEPREITRRELQEVHKEEYLHSLNVCELVVL